MKILGVSYFDEIGTEGMYMKPDTALLVNNKPFFLPPFAEYIQAKPCMIVKINRMGRNIQRKFARRYFTEFTIGLNLTAPSELLVRGVDATTKGVGFDNSFVVGKFIDYNADSKFQFRYKDYNLELDEHFGVISAEGAIEKISSYITLRNGDMIGIDLDETGVRLEAETQFEGQIDNTECFLCKIK